MTGINHKGRYGRYIQLILSCVDFIILNAAFFITAWLSPDFVSERMRTVWLLANVAYLPAAYNMSHTQTSRTLGMEHVIYNSFKAVAMHAPLFVCGIYFLEISHITWVAFCEFYGLMLLLLPSWWILSRLLIKYYRRRGRNFSKVVIVGTNSTALKLYEEISSDVGFGYCMKGFFDNEPHDGLPDGLYRGSLDDLDTYVTEHGIDEIFCTLPGECEDSIRRTLQIADSNVVQYYYVPSFSRYVHRDYEMYAMGTVPVMSVRHQPLSRTSNRILKRAFDIVFASVFLLCSPLIALPVAIAIKMSSPGPILFRQKRTGYRGREFYCYKFRTMKVNASADTQQATKNDPRKTRVGDFLRRTSIDELPQFINVLRGDMSVVGPRPHMLKHTEEYSNLINKYMLRHTIKPGITGWAQINGYRGQTEELWQMGKRVEYDVWYTEHWGLLLDLKIIFRTVYNAVRGEKNAF